MTAAFQTGEVIDGKYEVVALLGAGGMGHVFKVRHLQLDTFRTIKQLRRDLMADETYRGRFVREARMATRVQHPNVALVHDFATLPDGTSYIVSEFIEGMTLRQWMQAHGRFSRELALQIATQALAGIDVIHRASLVHRDISPDNIMIATGSNRQLLAKIIDLGIAKAADAALSDATQAGTFVGNPRYSSPEQLGALGGGETIDGRADLYCFGGVLFEMLAGQPPFTSDTPQGYALQHLTRKPPPLRAFDPSIPEGLDAAVLKALEKNRDQRYRSAREMSAALAPFATGVLTTTTQMKLEALTDVRENERLPDDLHAIVRRGDVSALSRLAELHPADSPIGAAVRPALDRMADEALAQEDEVEDAAVVAVLLEDGNPSEALAEQRHRSERAAFHAAIEALNAGDSRLAEELAARASAEHIRQRLKTVLADHYGAATWAKIAHSGSADEVREFLRRYPHHRLTGQAQERLRDLAGSAMSEQQAWDAAMTAGTEAAWLRFLQQYPTGARTREATSMLAEIRDYQRAMQSGTEFAYRVYLATWPRGRHHQEVVSSLRRLESGPSPAPEQPAAAPRALPMTRLEMIPGTAAAPLPAPLPVGERPPPRQMVWLYASGAALLAALLAAAIWWRMS